MRSARHWKSMESIMVSHSDELDEIVSTELSLDQLEAVSGGDQKSALLATTLSNLANMRHEMLKTVANNLRA
jgi:hypothetical protein